MTTSELKTVLRRNLRRALRERDMERADEILPLLLAEDPVSPETRAMELEVLIHRGRLDEAHGLAERLLRLHAASPRIQFLCGQLAYRRRSYGEAARCFRESERLHPHWRSQSWLARSLTQLGELGEAESLLLDLVAEHPHCGRDLAWLYERRGDLEQARRVLGRYLERFPDDELAAAQRLRLAARGLEGKELVAEVEGLAELGEAVPEAILAGYAEALVRLGRQEDLRAYLARHRSELAARTLVGIGWVCYRLQLDDLACDLWLRSFSERPGDYKLLNALEAAVRRSRRLEALIAAYREEAPRERSLYGRLRRLTGRAGEGAAASSPPPPATDGPRRD